MNDKFLGHNIVETSILVFRYHVPNFNISPSGSKLFLASFGIILIEFIGECTTNM